MGRSAFSLPCMWRLRARLVPLWEDVFAIEDTPPKYYKYDRSQHLSPGNNYVNTGGAAYSFVACPNRSPPTPSRRTIGATSSRNFTFTLETRNVFPETDRNGTTAAFPFRYDVVTAMNTYHSANVTSRFQVTRYNAVAIRRWARCLRHRSRIFAVCFGWGARVFFVK